MPNTSPVIAIHLPVPSSLVRLMPHMPRAMATSGIIPINANGIEASPRAKLQAETTSFFVPTVVSFNSVVLFSMTLYLAF